MNGPGPEPRIGDRERDSAVSALAEHFAAGRLTQDEFEERSTAAWQAKTASGLAPLFADLPQPHGVPPGWMPPRNPPTGYGPPWGRTYPPPAPPRYPVGPVPPSARRRFPWVPLLVLALVVSVATHTPFFVVALVGWALFSWSHRSHQARHTSGSRRDSRGTWS